MTENGERKSRRGIVALELPMWDQVVAHQRRIKELFLLEEPEEPVERLTGYSVELISREEARPLIMRYEWLGNMGRAAYFVGLLSPARRLHGAVCFGYGPAGYSGPPPLGDAACRLDPVADFCAQGYVGDAHRRRFRRRSSRVVQSPEITKK